MNIRKTQLTGVLLLEPNVIEDDRGFFFDPYPLQIFGKLEIPEHFVQAVAANGKALLVR